MLVANDINDPTNLQDKNDGHTLMANNDNSDLLWLSMVDDD